MKAIFNLDGSKPFEGLTFGHAWNGWACPYFTFDVGLKIQEMVGDCLKYSKDKDAFIFDVLDDEPEEYSAKIINGEKYYPIGNSSWCWDKVEKEEISTLKIKTGVVYRDNKII